MNSHLKKWEFFVNLFFFYFSLSNYYIAIALPCPAMPSTYITSLLLSYYLVVPALLVEFKVVASDDDYVNNSG